MCCSFKDFTLFIYSGNIFIDRHCKETSFRAESWRHASCHCKAGDSCSDRELPVIHPHMCEVKHGGFKPFSTMGWARRFSQAQSPTRTSAQRRTGNLPATQQKKNSNCVHLFIYFFSATLKSTWITSARLQQQGQNMMHHKPPSPKNLFLGHFQPLSHLWSNAA